jgi:hypothetical protein
VGESQRVTEHPGVLLERGANHTHCVYQDRKALSPKLKSTLDIKTYIPKLGPQIIYLQAIAVSPESPPNAGLPSSVP